MKKFVCAVFSLALITACFSSCTPNTVTTNYDNADKYSVGNGFVETAENLKINWVAGDVSVVYGDVDNITFTETTNKEIDEELSLHYYLDENTLYLQYKESGKHSLHGVTKDLKVEVPQYIAFEEVEINGVSCDINIDVTAIKIELDSVSGDSEIKSSVDSLDVETVSGDVVVQGVFNTLKVDGVSSNVKVYIPDDSGFTADLDSISGKFKFEEEIKKVNGKYVYGNGFKRIDVNTVSGDLTVIIFSQPVE